jgi:hypothetical protein
MNKAGLGLRFPALAIEKNRKDGALTFFAGFGEGSLQRQPANARHHGQDR